MLSTTIRVAAIVVVTLTLTTAAYAQTAAGSRAERREDDRSAPDGNGMKGFVLGVQTIGAQGVSITGPDIDGEFKTNFGMGAGVMLGYGFTRTLSAYVSLDVAKQRPAPVAYTYDATFGLAHLEAGLRAALPLGSSRTIPYLSASYGRRGIGAHVVDTEQERDYDMTLFGNVFGVGGGIEHLITPTLSLDAGASATFGKFDHYDGDGMKAPADVNASRSIRMRIGMNWRPGGRRS